MNVCFDTFGCRLNRAEAHDLEARVLAAGHRVVSSHKEADVLVVRGCSVTSRAQRDCEKLIDHLKRHYPNKRLVIMGCLPKAEMGLPRSLRLKEDDGSVLKRTARAYLKVQDGCAGQCAFCIVPKFRGPSVSEPFDAVLDKAKRFIDVGYHEIVVTGCNLALYADQGKRLPELVSALAELTPDCRIRLGSVEPWGCASEVVDAMAEHENVCRFLHLPVQSGSDRVLAAMNRPYHVADVAALVEKARKLMPFVSMGCDMMVGFPGESETDFVLSKNLLMKNAFSNVHVFQYSERPGTPAAKLKGAIQHAVRSARAHTLSDVGAANRARYARKFVGREVEVLVESHSVQPKGWTSEYLWFEGPLRSYSVKTSSRRQKLRFVVRSADKDVLHGVPVIASHGG